MPHLTFVCDLTSVSYLFGTLPTAGICPFQPGHDNESSTVDVLTSRAHTSCTQPAWCSPAVAHMFEGERRRGARVRASKRSHPQEPRRPAGAHACMPRMHMQPCVDPGVSHGRSTHIGGRKLVQSTATSGSPHAAGRGEEAPTHTQGGSEIGRGEGGLLKGPSAQRLSFKSIQWE